jgi:hypothetical protein
MDIHEVMTVLTVARGEVAKQSGISLEDEGERSVIQLNLNTAHF